MSKIIERARALRRQIERMAAALDDETAVEFSELTEKWEPGKEYAVDQRVVYNGVVYRVLTAHTAQANWTPADAPSLFAKVLIVKPDVIPEWEHPDSTNAYMIGDKVRYNGSTWESIVDNNVWAPDVYGWKQI